MKKTRSFLAALLFLAPIAFAGAEEMLQSSATPAPEDENSRNLFYYETTYTFDSDFHEPKLGHVDSFYNDFSYDRRFLIKGNWYFRTGLEYERFDFDGTDNGLPDHLQAATAHVALEIIVKDHAGAGLEIDPGIYFQDKITSDAFDFPWKIFATIPVKKDKFFAVIALGGGLYQDPPIAPGGGIIWLISDSVRLQAVFPKPALVYQPNDDWEFRLLGELNVVSFRTDDVLTTEGKLQLHNAVVQYSEDRVGAQVAYSGFKPFKISLSGGATVRREFDFFRANQAKRTDLAPYVRIAVDAKF
jgi:hypothetical protein